MNASDIESISWQILDGNSCSPVGQDCPNSNVSCIWNTLSTNTTFTLDAGGEYRVELTYINSTVERFYAKASQSTYSDVVSVIKDISVNGGIDGEISISASGNAPFIYQISNDGGNSYGPFQNSSIFTNLSAGSYQIKTRDSSGICEFISTIVELVEPKVLSATLIQTTVATCNQGAEILVTATGGVPPYQYALNGGAFVSTNVFSNLASGSYVVEVRDANGAFRTTNGIIITDSLPITATLTSHDITCGGMQNAQIEVQAFGGIGIYQYTLLDAETGIPIAFTSFVTTNHTFQNLSPGSYYVSVQDSGGCILDLPTTNIVEPTLLETTGVCAETLF